MGMTPEQRLLQMEALVRQQGERINELVEALETQGIPTIPAALDQPREAAK